MRETTGGVAIPILVLYLLSAVHTEISSRSYLLASVRLINNGACFTGSLSTIDDGSNRIWKFFTP